MAALVAIAQTESGRSDGNDVRTRPWVLNIDGHRHWADSRTAAIARDEACIAKGLIHIDIGCFPINHRWQKENFASVDQMLKPDAGALYTARFLERLYAETSDWSKAAGAYQASTPEYAARYRTQFDQFYAAAQQAPAATSRAGLTANALPLLMAGSCHVAIGPLVPIFERASR